MRRLVTILLLVAVFIVAIFSPVRAVTTAPIYGKVFYDLNRNRLYDAGEPIKAGLDVLPITVAEPNTPYIGTSNDAGDYSILVPIPDVYDLYVQLSDGEFSAIVIYMRNVDMTTPGSGNGRRIDIALPPSLIFLPVGK